MKFGPDSLTAADLIRSNRANSIRERIDELRYGVNS
jgi:hypothetical protein